MSGVDAPMRDARIFQARLEERLRELIDHLGRGRRADAAESADFMLRDVVDTKDTAFRAAAAELRELGLRNEARELADIRAALGRIAEGRYGQCIDCDEMIPEERLFAWPTAKRCRLCQSEYEKQQGRSSLS